MFLLAVFGIETSDSVCFSTSENSGTNNLSEYKKNGVVSVPKSEKFIYNK